MNTMIRRFAAVALMALVLIPLGAVAESAPSGGGTLVRSQMSRYNVDRSALSADQIAAYEKALSDYAAIEDEALSALVQSGDVTQQEVDQFTQMRDSQGLMASIQMETWTDAQRQSYMDAMSAEGDAREAALKQLVEEGLLTEAQAAAMSTMGGFFARRGNASGDATRPPQDGDAGNRVFTEGGGAGNGRLAGGNPDGNFQARSIDIWTQIMGMEQTETVQRALETMQAAQQVFLEALAQAGVQFN